MHAWESNTYNSVSGAGQGELAIKFAGVGDHSCINFYNHRYTNPIPGVSISVL